MKKFLVSMMDLSRTSVADLSSHYNADLAKPTKTKMNNNHSRNDLICQMRKRGLTLREIGERTGISKERVRQILNRMLGSTKYEWATTERLCELCGITKRRLSLLQKAGVVNPVFTWVAGRHRYSIWSPSVAEEISNFDRIYHLCLICHRPLPKGHFRYCSDECRRKRWEYKNMGPEQKQKHLDSIKRYRRKKRFQLDNILELTPVA